MKDLFSLESKVAVVTGGLGYLGTFFTQALVAYGAKVAIFNRKIPDEAVLRQKFPDADDNIIFIEADVRSKASLEAGHQEVVEKWSVPHVLVNNAGIDVPPGAPPEETGPFETYPEETWDRIIETNLKGIFLCCQVIGSDMAKAGRGSIINICSAYGLVSPNQAIYEYQLKKTGKPFIKPIAYPASKSGIPNITRYLATYWAQKGVRVNTLTPGGIGREGMDPEFIKNFCAKVPLGRQAREDELNGAIIFLSSEASSYMTGANLVVDGGFTAW